MLDSADQQRLHKLLSDTIPLLCKRTLGYSSEISVEAFIGVTLSDENAANEVVMVSFKETLLADGRVSSYVWSELQPSSAAVPPSLVEPVAFDISESGRSLRDGRESGLERNGEFEPSWDDDRCWAECDEAAVGGDAKVSSEPSTSTSLLSFPVKVEGRDDITDITKIGDDRDDFDINADLETTSNAGHSYENPYSSDVRRHSSAQGSHGIVNTHPNCLPTAGQRLSKSYKGSRKVMNHRVSGHPHSLQHSPSLATSKLHAIVKKASLPRVNTAMQSSRAEVSNLLYVAGVFFIAIISYLCYCGVVSVAVSNCAE